jgi:hypothetical protein
MTAGDTDTQYGFTWGPLEVTRLAHFKPRGDRESYVVRVATETGKHVDIYVSRTGRSLRVFDSGKELKAEASNG